MKYVYRCTHTIIINIIITVIIIKSLNKNKLDRVQFMNGQKCVLSF